jgi:trans-L-3-hydroxyproline dehydratase
MAVGQSREIRGVSGEGFVGTLASSVEGMSRVRVAGRAYYAARSTFLIEERDPFAGGFALPRSFGFL